jgi:hypothetical protein
MVGNLDRNAELGGSSGLATEGVIRRHARVGSVRKMEAETKPTFQHKPNESTAIPIPAHLDAAGIAQDLDDLFHESASPENPTVRVL